VNILQICNKSPYPPKEGGPIAMFNLAEGLIQAGHNVDVLAITTNKFFIKDSELPEDYRIQTSFSSVYINTSIKLTHAFFNLFSVNSFNVQRFDSVEMHDRIKEILIKKNFDLIQLETIYVCPYIGTIRKYSNARIILRAHNIEHLIWNRIASNEKKYIKRSYLYYLAKKLKRYEYKVFKNVDGIACISEIDTNFLKTSFVMSPIKTIPFGMKVPEYYNEFQPSTRLSFFHIGSMDWIPNQEGIKWFLENCMPILAKEIPNNKIYLAGRNMPFWVSKYKYPNLMVMGEVEDALKFIRTHDIMFVPLFSGSGVRIKILEGMALGKVIISTAIGAEGIQYTEGKNILIANTPEQFIEKFKFCIENPETCRQISTNAYSLFRKDHNIINTTRMLISFYKSIL
jgi:polysaccharide biosynthesis protein PslH